MATVADIHAIVLGVEGVLVRLTDLSRHAPWERRLGLAPGELAYDVLQSPSSCRACLGLMEDADVWMELGCLLFRLHADEMAALAEDFWSGMSVDAELRDVIRAMRSTLPVAGLSNAWPGARERYTRRYGLAGAFDTFVISAEEELVKPDTRIYELATERLGVLPEHTLFVDVDPRHVAGARDAGLQALRFVSTPRLSADLARLLPSPLEEPLQAQLVTEIGQKAPDFRRGMNGHLPRASSPAILVTSLAASERRFGGVLKDSSVNLPSGKICGVGP